MGILIGLGSGGHSFYRHFYEPFMSLLHHSLIDYSNLQKEMKEAVDTFESIAIQQ
ncbi:hypothetical protein KQI49_00785 [Virgibacillus sp. MSJ-26]|uniref:hypothetical protein n=1 Tax=Virgibacillus sp. MSJ-26 TaxID=2841522 RepID=UPI001C1267F1|nr:hypothetical protein [Virgibacillus sp. MSJ-26]MBU5465361.1 hypothetical protein [Virgibacillus sp. MSJ-26]